MPAFDDLVRSGYALAKTFTASLQVTVTLRAWLGQTALGDASYGPARSFKVLVEYKQRMVVNRATGNATLARALVTFLEPVAPVGGVEERNEPIDTRDQLTLPDGSTGPIIDVQGLADPDTNETYAPEVWVGSVGSGGGR